MASLERHRGGSSGDQNSSEKAATGTAEGGDAQVWLSYGERASEWRRRFLGRLGYGGGDAWGRLGNGGGRTACAGAIFRWEKAEGAQVFI